MVRIELHRPCKSSLKDRWACDRKSSARVALDRKGLTMLYNYIATCAAFGLCALPYISPSGQVEPRGPLASTSDKSASTACWRRGCYRAISHDVGPLTIVAWKWMGFLSFDFGEDIYFYISAFPRIQPAACRTMTFALQSSCTFLALCSMLEGIVKGIANLLRVRDQDTDTREVADGGPVERTGWTGKRNTSAYHEWRSIDPRLKHDKHNDVSTVPSRYSVWLSYSLMLLRLCSTFRIRAWMHECKGVPPVTTISQEEW